MSIMSFSKLRMPAANLNEQSSVPPITDVLNVQQRTKSELGEDEGLFIGYGFVDGSFPYSHQDMYDRECGYKEFESIVLENNYLKATFIPSLGGRLWSLFDKVAKRKKVVCMGTSYRRP